MKLLLVVSSLKDIESFLEKSSVVLQQHASLKYLSTAKILHHEVDFLVSGVGVFQTTYKITKALSLQKYHLALKLGFGNAYKEDIETGAVLNVVNEKPGDYGMMVNGEWKDLYDFGLMNREDEPHIRGGFVNLTNAYMNVFMPYKKVVGITVNNYADKNSVQLRREKYKADCETGDGIGFVYPCLFEKQSYYQLCVIERNLVTGEENFNLAKEKMSETLEELILKL